jgi:hypothetical protein
MVFAICTGSPEYETAEDIRQCPNVADQVFGKPVTNIDKLENTIKDMLADKSV